MSGTRAVTLPQPPIGTDVTPDPTKPGLSHTGGAAKLPAPKAQSPLTRTAAKALKQRISTWRSASTTCAMGGTATVPGAPRGLRSRASAWTPSSQLTAASPANSMRSPCRRAVALLIRMWRWL